MSDAELHPIVVGAVIRYLRKRKGLSQEQLAERLRTGQCVISRIEDGQPIRAYQYTQIARALKIRLGDLHDLVTHILVSTRRAADAIRPGALDTVDVDPSGLVRFVVEFDGAATVSR